MVRVFINVLLVIVLLVLLLVSVRNHRVTEIPHQESILYDIEDACQRWSAENYTSQEYAEAAHIIIIGNAIQEYQDLTLSFIVEKLGIPDYIQPYAYMIDPHAYTLDNSYSFSGAAPRLRLLYFDKGVSVDISAQGTALSVGYAISQQEQKPSSIIKRIRKYKIN